MDRAKKTEREKPHSKLSCAHAIVHIPKETSKGDCARSTAANDALLFNWLGYTSGRWERKGKTTRRLEAGIQNHKSGFHLNVKDFFFSKVQLKNRNVNSVHFYQVAGAGKLH